MNESIEIYTLENKNNVKVILTNYGARIVSFIVPDSKGIYRDIILGYDNIEDIVNGNEYFGATIGRFANRIALGKFSIDGKEYSLLQNNGSNALHGGEKGYHNIIWKASQTNQKVIMEHNDPDMHEGYPGNVEIKVTYELTDDNELKITYDAKTDKTTHLNVTNHAFFNLRGAGNGNILDHKLQINADKYTPINKNQIPTGDIVEVKNTPFDFTELTKIGKRIDEDNEILANGFGYDHNWVINGDENELKFCAKVIEPEYGIVMKVFTTEPGVQLYTGNFLDKSDIGREGVGYGRREAFCLETQHFPDSPNKEHFPKTLLTPDEKFYSQSVYKIETN